MSTEPNPIRFGLVLVVVVIMLSIVSNAFSAVVPLTPRDAIERAIVDRMGGSVSVLVEVLRSDVISDPSLQALPDPAARSGHAARFVLTAGGVRKGIAVASVEVQASYARASRAIDRDEVVTAAAVEIVNGELPGVAFRRLPTAGEVVGLKARRAIVAGEPLTAAVLEVPPVVQSGDEVTATVKVGRVEINTVTVASGSGQAGDIIRVLAPNSRRPLKARILGRGAVEVLQ